MHNYILKFILLLIIINPDVQSQTKELFPKGWSITEKENYYSETLEFLKGRIPNHIEADFNDDKMNDQAWILINRYKNKFGLFVRLGNKKKIIKLEQYRMDNKNSKIDMGISVVEPGKYTTACGKGYWDCKSDEPAVIELLRPSINFFLFEGASSFFYWDDHTNRFKRIWISD